MIKNRELIIEKYHKFKNYTNSQNLLHGKRFINLIKFNRL